ncbi:MAG: RNA-directed DNA polymerase, partial [Cyclobacteriaceae bacterium]|nr:RNA-directed DNA polymerase [Cyclobacteriaceae bacterium]
VKFDAALSEDAYGSRLRRVKKDKTQPNSGLGEYQPEGLGSFSPYFTKYKIWREKGFKIIRQQLDNDESVVVMTMDISSFYHRIDPTFIKNTFFLNDAKIDLETWELKFTQFMANLLNFWSKQVRKEIKPLKGSGVKPMGGIPIGLTISRVISNALMINFDRVIQQELTPLYYGRYVDDIILVFKNPGNINSSEDALKYIGRRLNTKECPKYFDNGKINVAHYTKCKSEIKLQPNKMKTFVLKGASGLHMIDNIEEEIIRVSSERKLLHTPSELKSMRATKVVTTSSSDPDNIDSFRRAEGVSIKRLGFGVLFRDVITWAHDLEPKDWKTEREEFYQIGYNYLFTPLTIFENMKYISRYISLAISVQDWNETVTIINKILNSLSMIGNHHVCVYKINGYEVEPSVDYMKKAIETVVLHIREAISRSAKVKFNQDGRPIIDNDGNLTFNLPN